MSSLSMVEAKPTCVPNECPSGTPMIANETRGSTAVTSPDAIHLACAASAGTDLFLTNDKNLVGKISPGIQFIASLETPLL